jgi:pimeloyl-ACP methyl ester carboxylesterase
MTRPTSTIARRRPAERRRRPAKGSRHEVVLHGQHLSYLEAGRRSGGPTPLASLADPGTRGAFVQTTRAALDRSGQRLDGTGRLHLLADVPVLIVAGRQDACIPVEHSVRAHDLLPGSRLEVFEHAGHFPHAEHPGEFAAALLDFVASTTAARTDASALRRRLGVGRRAPARPLRVVEDSTA